MSALQASFASITISVGALILAVIALMLVGGAGNDGNNPSPPGTVTFITPQISLSLRDTRSQSLNAANAWTDVRFNRNTYISDAWTHDTEAEDADHRVISEVTGLYVVYLSIQAQTNSTTAPACKACNLRYAIRAIQNTVVDGEDVVFEVPGSLTYSNGHNLFLSKQFHVNATAGDVFTFQFVSKCETLHLEPNADSSPVDENSRPVSATLVIT